MFLLLFINSCDKDKDETDVKSTNKNVTIIDEDANKNINEILSDKSFSRGMIRLYNREYQAAIQIFSKALSLNPLNFRARYYLGKAYLYSGYTKNAMDEWENLIALGGGNYQIKQKLNDLYFRLAIDKNYEYTSPYILSKIYDGITEGMHKVLRPSFIFYDTPNDTIFVSTAKTRYVVEIDGNGNVLRQIGRKLGDFSAFGLPTGIAIYNDKIYIADYKTDLIHIFQRNGKHINEFGIKGYKSSNLSGPMGLYIDKNEYLFIVDNGNNRLQKFDLDGNWIQSIGEGELDRPTDIVGYDKNIFVSDTYNSRVIHYDNFGNIVEIIGENQLKRPYGLAIKHNKLYIVDSKQGAFVYNLQSKEMEKLGVDEGKLKFPFDICIDSRDLLYETDFNTQNIAIFIPLQLRYANLGVSVNQVWQKSYPNSLVHLRVWDKKGMPIYDLKEENISVKEEGENIPFARFGATAKYRKNMYIQFVIDKSINTKSFFPELEESFETFLGKMSGNDWLEVTTVNTEIKTSGKLDANVLLPLEFVKTGEFTGNYPNKLGEALYNATTRLLNVNRNKAIVLFTSGKIGINSFTNYNEEVVITYARENAIPIYIIVLANNSQPIFQRIASETYGNYYNLSSRAEMLDLHNEIKNSRPLEYILSYEGLNLLGLKNYWVNVHLRVKYKSMIGVDDFGYFVPEIRIGESFGGRSDIDLEKEYSDKN